MPADFGKHYVCYHHCGEDVYFGQGNEEKIPEGLDEYWTNLLIATQDDSWKKMLWRHVDTKSAMCKCYAEPSNLEASLEPIN